MRKFFFIAIWFCSSIAYGQTVYASMSLNPSETDTVRSDYSLNVNTVYAVEWAGDDSTTASAKVVLEESTYIAFDVTQVSPKLRTFTVLQSGYYNLIGNNLSNSGQIHLTLWKWE